MRDFLAATRERIVVFDGGMGATLEQFDLSLEHDYRLPGRCHEALVLNRPDVIEGVHASMLEAGAEVLETDTFQASRLKLAEWGLERPHARDQRQGRPDRPRGRRRATASSPARSARPASCPPATTRRSARSRFRRAASRSSPSRRRACVEGGVDLIIIETAQDILEVKAAVFGAREAFTRDRPHACRSSAACRCCRNGGKMLLGTDISAVLATLEALDVDVIGLNCSTGPEDMRDAIRFLGEFCSVPVHCIPNAGLPLQGPNGETIFPEQPEPLADVLGEFVERYGVSIVGGCCGTTPGAHRGDRRARRAADVPAERPARRAAARRAR